MRGARVLSGAKARFRGGVRSDCPCSVADVLVAGTGFRPLCPADPFALRRAIELANRSEFGLAAYFYSRDLARVFRVAEALESGMVGINTGMIANEAAPFGGVKQSGLGREGSRHGIEEYVEMKYLCIAGL